MSLTLGQERELENGEGLGGGEKKAAPHTKTQLKRLPAKVQEFSTITSCSKVCLSSLV